MATFGFIGTGNMGGALARAVCKRVPSDEVFLANRTMEKAQALAAELECRVADNEAIARSADFIFLGVKPQMMADMLADIAPVLEQRETRFVLVSMAAGLSLEDIARMAGGDYAVIRIMPNTPSAIGEGMILYTCGKGVTKTEEKEFLDSMAGAGRFAAIPESQMDVGSAVSGCGPAFVDLFIEALADGGVQIGLPRDKAQAWAAQMVAGAAGMVLQTGKHPGQLKDAVCSPGGTTIAGVAKLEQGAFRSLAAQAVVTAYEKNSRIGK